MWELYFIMMIGQHSMTEHRYNILYVVPPYKNIIFDVILLFLKKATKSYYMSLLWRDDIPMTYVNLR